MTSFEGVGVPPMGRRLSQLESSRNSGQLVQRLAAVFDTRQNWRITSRSFSVAILPPSDAYGSKPLKACYKSPVL